MRDGWQTRKLEDVCQFSSGLWKGEQPPFMKVGVIRNTNFTKDGTLDFSAVAYLDVEARQYEKRRLKHGDVILEKSGGGPKQPVGRVALFDRTDGDFSFSNFTSALRVTDPTELDFRFLHKFLHWNYLSGVTEAMQSHSTGIRNLDGKTYKAIQISFPSLPEQRRIVAVLDEAFEAIAAARANAEANLRNARDLFESQLQMVFTHADTGHPMRRLHQICMEITVGHVGPMAAHYRGKGVPFLRSQNIRPFQVSLDGLTYIDDDFHRSLSKSQLKPGDVAVVRTGYPGTAAVIPESLPVSNCADLVIVRPDSQADPQYLALFFNSTVGKKLVAGKLVGAAQKHFNVAAAKDVGIPFPPLSEQRREVAAMMALREETQHLESQYEQKLTSLETLKRSLLHQAFTGQLGTQAA